MRVSLHPAIDGIVTLSLSNIYAPYSLDGDQLAILNGPNQYVVAPDRTTVTLASGLNSRKISYAGDVVLVAGVALTSPTDLTGNLVLVRYRPSTGVQSMPIRTNVSRTATIVLATDYTFGDSISPDGSLAVATYTYSTPGPPIITIVRSLGMGSRPQPLF